MKKMKKLLALMCIAIAALIWLPGLKFPVEAGGIDYEEMVLVESGEDVTLSINLSKLNLPAGFEVGSCNCQCRWWNCQCRWIVIYIEKCYKIPVCLCIYIRQE